MKKLAGVLVIVFALVVSSLAVGDDNVRHGRKIEDIKSRAAGGVDVSTDTNTPANAALAPDGWYLTILNVEAVTGLSQLINIVDFLGEFSNFSSSLQTGTDQLSPPNQMRTLKLNSPNVQGNANYDQLVRLARLAEGRNMDMETQLRVDVLRFVIGNKAVGKFSIGGYAEGEAATKVAMPKPDQITPGPGGFPDIGRDRDVMHTIGRGDVGGFLSYGKAVELPLGMEVAAGITTRVFHRYAVPGYDIRFQRHIRSSENIETPGAPDYYEGTGCGLDGYLTVAPHDFLFDTKVALAISNIYGQVWYDDGSSPYESTRFAVGMSLSPFHWADFDDLVLGADAENIQVDVNEITWQTGLSYKLGNDKYNLMPAAGMVFNRLDMLGSGSGDMFTAGLFTHIAFVSLGGLFELNISETELYNVGIKLAVEI